MHVLYMQMQTCNHAALAQLRFIIKSVKELDGIDLLHISTRADELFKQERLKQGADAATPKSS